MLELTDLLLIALAAGLLNYWWRSRYFRDHALALARRRCDELEVQLLDQSVVLVSIVPARDEEGRLALRRCYRFEFSSTGEVRNRGWITLSGWRLVSIELEPHLF